MSFTNILALLLKRSKTRGIGLSSAKKMGEYSAFTFHCCCEVDLLNQYGLE